MSGCLINSIVERYRYALVSLSTVPTKKKEVRVMSCCPFNTIVESHPMMRNRYSIFLTIFVLILYFIIFATRIYDPLLIPFVRTKF
jgi:hypothetical protein